jgi:hypothetical protein
MTQERKPSDPRGGYVYGQVQGDSIIINLGHYAWVVIAAPLVPFFNSLMTKAGEDAYQIIKVFVGGLLAARKLEGEENHVILRDPDQRVDIVIEPDLPDEAFQQLLSIDPAKLDRNIRVLEWDRSAKKWQPGSESQGSEGER